MMNLRTTNFLVMMCAVYCLRPAHCDTTDDPDYVTADDVTTMNPTTVRTKEQEADLLQKALIAKRRKMANFDQLNMQYLNNAAGHEDAKRSTNFRHRDRDREYVQKRGKHRSMLMPPKERKPNIILILTDDQDVELGSLNFMPRTMRLLRDGGADFRHAYVTTPLCCPSRSSLLTGMYVHNHNVFTNNENCSSQAWQRTHETRTFATYLSNAGYRTGYFGKYLNKYNGSYVPPGWREWGGLIKNSRYYNYSINLNGRRVRHGDNYERDYYTDLIANDSVSFLRQSKQYFSRKPVMLVVSFPAPHGPEDSAPQYSNMFFNVTTHHTPAYDYAPNPDKQWILQVTNRMQGIHKQFTDLLMTKRLQTLQSVDVAVERIYQELKHIGELDNTYIVYTSDHGYHLGQFGLLKGKSFPFESDVRVPFLVRGPGITPGTKVEDIVLNLDLAPTFLDMAGVETPPHMDGRSILKLLHPPRNGRKPRWPDSFLIESSGRRDTPDSIMFRKHLHHFMRTPQIGLENTTDGSGQSEDSGEEMDEDEEVNIPGPPMPTVHDDNKIPGLPARQIPLALECQRREFQAPCGDELRTDESLLHVLHLRRKRDVEGEDHISDIVDDLDAELEEAQETEVSLQNSTLWQCSVTSKGNVNCSDVVYSDYQTWRQTRLKTEAKIRLLKGQLTALKELRKHLRERKPYHMGNESLSTTQSTITTDLLTTFTFETSVSTTTLPPSTTADLPDSSTVGETRSTIGQNEFDNSATGTTIGQNGFDNRIDRIPKKSDQDTCYCSSANSHYGGPRNNEKDVAKEARRRLKEEKLRDRERKIRKKAKMEKECLSERMNCFYHDKTHWRTPPFWSEEPFCFCMNANNNSYSCMRTINSTHNFLYCEFVTGLATFYNIRIDPFEQLNRAAQLTPDERKQLSEQLKQLKSCRGTKECTMNSFVKWQ